MEDQPTNEAPVGDKPSTSIPPSLPSRQAPVKAIPSTSNPRPTKAVLVRRRKVKEESLGQQLTTWFVKNQIGLSSNLLALLFLAHTFIPKARPHTYKFFTLSYYNDETGKYGVGIDDGCLIAFFVVLFTGLRAGFIDHILTPLGKSLGLRRAKDALRFSEQAWLLVYYGVFWTLGVYLYVTSPYFLNLQELWTNWPDRELPAVFKFYILAQWSFWIQQIVVINIEERRKDHWQMFTHHIITIGLLSSCYNFHQTRIGNLILVLFDIVDILLPLAKCFKYVGYSILCDVMFGVFMVVWFITRHIFYPMVCWSVYRQSTEIIGNSCFSGTPGNMTGPFEPPPGLAYMVEPFFSTQGIVCHDTRVKWAFLGPLLTLEVMTLIWFSMIVRVAVKVIRGDGAEDSRSDDEGDDEEEEVEEDEFIYEEAQPLEEEVGVEQLDLKNWERRTGLRRQAKATSSGVSLPGHSDRKELLGRIGCEKQLD